tara:strand:+ start:520 stop:939 length:420 start_codon:yes stop_codon:yes gene_type:complete
MSTYNYLSSDIEYNKVPQETITATGDVSESQPAVDYNIATDALTVGLPLITSGNLGSTFLFRNTGADAAAKLAISPQATNKIVGSITGAAAVFSASGVLDKDVENAKATALNGDYIVLRSISLTEYAIIGGVGVWSSEA